MFVLKNRVLTFLENKKKTGSLIPLLQQKVCTRNYCEKKKKTNKQTKIMQTVFMGGIF